MSYKNIFIAACFGLVFGGNALANTPPARPVAIEQLVKHSEFSRLTLSPDQTHIAALAPHKGRQSLVVMEIATRKTQGVAFFHDADIGNINWISPNRITFTLVDRQAGLGAQDWEGLYAVNKDGSNLRELSVRKDASSVRKTARFIRFVRPADQVSDDMIVMAEGRTPGGLDLFRMNSHTGKKTLLTAEAPAKAQGHVLDNNNVARIAVHSDNNGRKTTLYGKEGSEWIKLNEFDTLAPSIAPLAFDQDNETLYVSSDRNGDKAAIYKYDFKARDLGEKLVEHADVDLTEGLIFDRSRKLVGLNVEGTKPETYWFDEAWANAQATVDQALPKTHNRLQGDPANRLLVFSYSDVSPGVYYLYDPKQQKLEELAATRPWIKPSQMSEVKVIQYKARDELSQFAYLTLPKGKEAKKLPLIVYAHGGPWARDDWGFDPYLQFFASRGYAVLQPQFRGSTGFGRKLFQAGWKTWGKAMQDDLEDGINHLAAQGIVDPSRVCIAGGSYGGYAAIWGLVKTPDLYRCGLSFIGVTDVKLLFTLNWSDTFDSPWMKYGAKSMIGDPDKDDFEAISPVKHASLIKAPLLLVYGEEDVRVPLAHGEVMRTALDKYKKVYEWMVLKDEAHGFMKEESNERFLKAMESFLKKHNPAD